MPQQGSLRCVGSALPGAMRRGRGGLLSLGSPGRLLFGLSPEGGPECGLQDWGPCLAAGLAAARERGRIGGRPVALSQEQKAMVEAMMQNPALSVGKIAATVGVSRATVYRAFPKGRVGQ